MREQTREFIEEIRRTDFFYNIGNSENNDVISLHSWKESYRANRGASWDWILLESRNVFSQYLHDNFSDRYYCWNQIIGEVNVFIKPLVNDLIVTLAPPEKESGQIEATLGWCLQVFCMAKEFEDIYNSQFYWNLWEWYKKGHFPCGWEGAVNSGGDFQKTIAAGKLIVF